jgi:hypothetical protein
MGFLLACLLVQTAVLIYVGVQLYIKSELLKIEYDKWDGV